jgi:hypothetical protein
VSRSLLELPDRGAADGIDMIGAEAGIRMRKSDEIRHIRLRNQRLAPPGFTRPEDVVSWLGAVQAQEYPGAKWGLALRTKRPTNRVIERAFADGRILRTHVMRPTWHFVSPADIRWMLALTAPRVRTVLATYDRKLGIDATVINRSNRTIAAALRGGAALTRQELKVALGRAGIVADGVQRLAHLVIHAELDAVVCSGPLRGKQFTYALLEERIPQHRVLPREEALAELTRRYFSSRGPAQVHDFAWWSGLTTADARAGLEMARPHLASDVIDGRTYWLSPTRRRAARPLRTALLLPLYDEYLIAYKDRSASLDPVVWAPIVRRDPFSSPIVIDGQVVGGWKPVDRKGTITITVDLPASVSKSDRSLVAEAADRVGRFFEREITLRRT